jgi:phosphoribosyl 1,2-cyclic phosphodiesterase
VNRLRVTVLGSGSSGNALVVDNGRVAVLVDAGFGCRALSTRLAAAGYQPEAIAALVLTHEHVDHAHGAMAAARRWNWPIFGSSGTLSAVRRDDDRRLAAACASGSPAAQLQRAIPVQAQVLRNGTVTIDSLTFAGQTVSHDASEPLGYIIDDSLSGARIGIAVDLGHAPRTLVDQYAGLDLLVLESNHDVDMLRTGPYPASLKRRIASRQGHLSNAEAGEFAAACAHRGLRHVVLAHLSETNNRPEHAVRSVRDALVKRGWSDCTITATSQRAVSATISATRGSRPAPSAVQLQLGF